MFEKDPSFVEQQVRQVIATWHVTPSGPGSGVGDVANWVNYIIHAKGWEPYWVDRIGEECARSGYSQSAAVPPPSGGDPYMDKLNELNQKLDVLITGLHPRYF